VKLVAAAAVALALAVGAWNAGELHRRNCETAGRTACSVLPWQSGKQPPLTLKQLARKYGLGP
jgi:hypothetical protein